MQRYCFNLRFGVSKTPDQGVAYEQLYPLLVTLRNQAYSGAPVASATPPPPPDPKSATAFFSGMEFNHFEAQPPPQASTPGRGTAPAPAPAPVPNAVP